MKEDWVEMMKKSIGDYNVGDYSIGDYNVGDYYTNKKYFDIDGIMKHYEDAVKKATIETEWRKTVIEPTDEEKLEKMDLGVIEKFLRKKKLEQLAKSEK